MKQSRLSVVMVSWMTGPRLMESVRSVLAVGAVDEFVFVSHENPDRALNKLRALDDSDPRFKLIETGDNLGFARGCNIGADVAGGDLLLFLNPDAVLSEASVDRLLKSAGEMNGRPWAIGGRVVNDDGSEQRGARRGALTPGSALVSFLGLERVLPGIRGMHWENEEVPEGMTAVPTVSGAAILMRRDEYLKLGGIDERYFLHVEDIDLCRMIRESGGTVWFEPRAPILHFGGTSEASTFRVETHKAMGLVQYFWKFYRNPLQRLLTLFMAIPIFSAIWARVAWIGVRDIVRGSLQHDRAMRRLRRIKSNGRKTGHS